MKSRFKLSFNGKVMMVVISLVCAITMLMVPTLVLAANTTDNVQSGIQPRWSYLWICEQAIDYAENISPGIMVYGSTQTYDGCYSEVEIQLEKYTTSGIWVNVPTYYWSSYSESDYTEVFEDDISVSPGVYRCSLVHTAYDVDGIPLESTFSRTVEITVRGN